MTGAPPGALWRMAIFLAWRNYLKSFPEQTQGATPAQALGVLDRKRSLDRGDDGRGRSERLRPELLRPEAGLCRPAAG